MTSTPQNAIWNAGDLYLNGMEMTYVSTTSFTVNQGQARDSTNVNDIFLKRPPLNNGTPVTTAFTLSSAISGAGGLDTGTIGNNKFYYVFAIASSGNSTINLPPSSVASLNVPPFTTPSPTSPVAQDAYYTQANVMISLSLTNPLLPYGFDMFRCIGGVATDGSGHFLAFTQTGKGLNRTMRYQVPVSPGSAATSGSATYASVGTLTNYVPQKAVDVIMSVALTPNSANNKLYLNPYGGTAIASNGFEAVMSGAATGSAQQAVLTCPVAFNAATPSVVELDYATTSASDAQVFLIMGYVDAL